MSAFPAVPNCWPNVRRFRKQRFRLESPRRKSGSLMRSFIAIFLSAIMATSAVAQEQTPASQQTNSQQQQTLAQAIAECSNEPGSTRPPCNVSKNDAKKAKKFFEHGL